MNGHLRVVEEALAVLQIGRLSGTIVNSKCSTEKAKDTRFVTRSELSRLLLGFVVIYINMQFWSTHTI